jgi:hypothetical protein
MSLEDIRKSNGARQQPGKVQRTAAFAALAAMLLAPVVCLGLLRSNDPLAGQAPISQSGTIPASDSKSSDSARNATSTALSEKRMQIAEDTSQLLRMATDLKAEVDKTNKDTLSLSVIRKAGAIEKLAHSVRDKMKTEMGME